MQSNNPVFRRSEAFNGQATGQANAYGNQTYAGNGSSYAGYGDPATWGTGTLGLLALAAGLLRDDQRVVAGDPHEAAIFAALRSRV